MRWNCPHCRIDLEASDDQVSSTWLFSLCPKCSRFGLIRANSTAAVKVDRAPTGEKFIRASAAGIPVIKPAQPRARAAAPEEITKIIAEPPKSQFKFVAPVKLPEPLPEVPEGHRAIFPRLVLLGCLCMLAWNGYRFLEIRQETSRSTASNSGVEMKDQVVAKAMAPVQIEVGSLVQANSDRMMLRNGPGYQFPVIGELYQDRKYQVLSVEEPWYQVQAQTKTPAWVMSDEITPAN